MEKWQSSKSIALRIAVIYLIIGVSWIIFSDKMLIDLGFSYELVNKYQTLKGIIFIFITSVAIYLLIWNDLRALKKANISRENALIKLNEQNSIFESVIKSVTSGVIIFDDKGEMIFINHQAKNTLHISKDKLIGGNWKDIELYDIDKNKIPEEEHPFRIAESGDNTFTHLEYTYRDDNSGWMYFSIGGSQYFNSDNEYAGVVLTIGDITEQKETLNKLMLHTKAVKSSASGIVITDENGRIEWVNPAFEKMSKYNQEEMAGRNPREIVKSGMHNREFYKNLWTTISGGGTWSGEIINKNKHGRMYVEEQVINPVFGEKGKITHYVAVKQDVTKQKQKENEIRDLSSKLEHYIKTNPAVIYSMIIVGDKPRMSWMSENVESLLGYSNSEIIKNDKWQDFIHSEDIDNVLAARDEVFVNEQSSVEFRFLNKEGNYIWILDSLKILKNEKGNPVEIIGIWIDISEKKDYENRLINLNKTLTNILSASPIGVLQLDIEGKVTYCNEAMEKLFGWQKDEYIGNYPPYIPDSKIKEYREKNEKFLKGGNNTPVRLERKNKWGENVIIEVYRSVVKDENENSTGILGFVLDVTEQERARAALKDSEAKLKEIFTNSPIGIYRSTLDGKVLEANSALLEIFGYSSLQEAGEDAIDIKRDIYAEPSERDHFIKELWKNGDVRDFQFQVKTKSGDLIWLAVDAALKHDQKSGKYVIDGFARDITEAKNSRIRLEKLLNERDVLIKEIYHRSKNNMQVIAAMIGLQIMNCEDKYTKEILREIESKIYSISLVHEKLYKSSNLSVIDLKDYAGDLVKLILKSFDRDSDVAFDFESEQISVVLDIAVPIGLVLNELITNSLKHAFVSGNGKISIEIKTYGEKVVEIDYQDNGPGFKEYELEEAKSGIGIQTIVSIVESQLGGSILFAGEDGFYCGIRLDKHYYKERV